MNKLIILLLFILFLYVIKLTSVIIVLEDAIDNLQNKVYSIHKVVLSTKNEKNW